MLVFELYIVHLPSFNFGLVAVVVFNPKIENLLSFKTF
jgi:hypothetical protein